MLPGRRPLLPLQATQGHLSPFRRGSRNVVADGRLWHGLDRVYRPVLPIGDVTGGLSKPWTRRDVTGTLVGSFVLTVVSIILEWYM